MRALPLSALLAATLLAAALIFVATPALSCTFDAECPLSERCLKQPGKKTGHCGNYDSGLRDPLDLGAPQKNLCSQDIDCGIGGTCLAVGGLYGTCVGM